MPEYKDVTTAIDKGVYIIHNENLKITPEYSINYTAAKQAIAEKNVIKSFKSSKKFRLIVHYTILFLLGLSTWGLLWSAFGEGWSWNGRWFRPAIVALIAWSTGLVLQYTTTLPPLLAALATGIVARNLGYLDMREYTEIDGFLRKIYPVVILGKGSLAWDVYFMKKNWKLVTTLGVLPWVAEVTTLAICMNLLLGYPWIWGFLLGTIYASLSCPVIMPSISRLCAGREELKKWPKLICTAGGLDTALSVGVFGVIHGVIFHQGNDNVYRYCKAAFALILGVLLGAGWGSLARFLPHTKDVYVTELRVLFVLIGGLLASFITSKFGWGGTAGVAVLACNATAATHWAKDGWRLNNNPAATAYRVMWSSLEPALFAYTGTFFVLKSSMTKMMLIGFGILFICLLVRLTVAYLMCTNMTVKEKLFVCCTWVPKSIVEAVLSPLAINTLLSTHDHDEVKMEYAEGLLRLIVQAIIITTPIGYLLLNYLGPYLLREKRSKCQNESEA